jgi:hypothetical protein
VAASQNRQRTAPQRVACARQASRRSVAVAVVHTTQGSEPVHRHRCEEDVRCMADTTVRAETGRQAGHPATACTGGSDSPWSRRCLGRAISKKNAAEGAEPSHAQRTVFTRPKHEAVQAELIEGAALQRGVHALCHATQTAQPAASCRSASLHGATGSRHGCLPVAACDHAGPSEHREAQQGEELGLVQRLHAHRAGHQLT